MIQDFGYIEKAIARKVAENRETNIKAEATRSTRRI